MTHIEERLLRCEAQIEQMRGQLFAAHLGLSFALAQRPDDENLMPFCKNLIEFMSQQVSYLSPQPSELFLDAFKSWCNTLPRMVHVEVRSPTKTD
ncbi:hypothetical protein [Ralstonia insidiosa]|uniref:hypothetical protein n=1 Tax=Ralstonia insidiosa TaxID=190721 RepID=UPI000CEEC163|nr:hypothetical protein [Ralstonia insidiosa]